MPVVAGLAQVEPHHKGAGTSFNGGWQQDDDNPEVRLSTRIFFFCMCMCNLRKTIINEIVFTDNALVAFLPIYCQLRST